MKIRKKVSLVSVLAILATSELFKEKHKIVKTFHLTSWRWRKIELTYSCITELIAFFVIRIISENGNISV